MTVHQALPFYEAVPPIREKLQTLQDVGLGYIRLGPGGDDAVGRRGAADQARRRSCPSARPGGRSTSWTSRRPASTSTTSASCWRSLQRLVDGGNTVVVIEHNLDVIKSADWIIDLGPEGGDVGGRIIGDGNARDRSRAFAESRDRRIRRAGVDRRAARF